jgi:hypothetical protein
MVLFKTLFQLLGALSLANEVFPGNLVQEVVEHACLNERAGEEPLSFVHVSDDCCIVNELNVACLEPRLHGIVADHVHVQAVPEFVHDFEKLEHQVVLSKVVT